MTITKEEVKKVAHLSYIKLSDEEVEIYTKELGQILNWIQVLQEVNTDNIEPMKNIISSLPEFIPNIEINTKESCKKIQQDSIKKEEEYNIHGYEIIRNSIHELPMRKDIAVEQNIQKEVLQNAPLHKYGYFVVPKAGS